MSDLAKIAVFLGVGLASGAVFFGVLDRLNARIAERAGRHVTAYVAGTLILRLVLLGALLFFSLRTGIAYLFVTFIAFMIARAVCLRVGPKADSAQENE